jgi:hypothetical protein
MTKKTLSKQLAGIEKQFAQDNPTLHEAVKVLHELDQIEYDLGLIDDEDTTATKTTWWPIISIIGGNTQAASRFIQEYIDIHQARMGTQTTRHKFAVMQYCTPNNDVILPGTALDADHRLPFHSISKEIDRASPGSSQQINAFIELKTISNDRLKDKLFIQLPHLTENTVPKPVFNLLAKHTIDISDLVLVFADSFNAEPEAIEEIIRTIVEQQDSNKFVYIIDQPPSNKLDVSPWQRKLDDLGIKTTDFIGLSSQISLFDPVNAPSISILNQRINKIGLYRNYRIMNTLEKNIRDITEVFIPEIVEATVLWKERSTFSSLLILGFIATLMLFAEIQIGFFAMLFDPIIGPLFLVALTGFMIPVHIGISRLQAKLIIGRLNDRQKELNIMENLSGVFEKSLTSMRMLLPSTTPVGWNKEMKARLNKLTVLSRELVLSMNDRVQLYGDESPSPATISVNSFIPSETPAAVSPPTPAPVISPPPSVTPPPTPEPAPAATVTPATSRSRLFPIRPPENNTDNTPR